jgi:hypothetical protein
MEIRHACERMGARLDAFVLESARKNVIVQTVIGG